MRMKALGVALMVGFAAFTTFYWITDAPRRDAEAVTDDEERLEFGQLVFLPDDSYTVAVEINDQGFALTEIPLFLNTTLSFENKTDAPLTVTGTGVTAFEVEIEPNGSAPQRFSDEGESTITATGADNQLVVTGNPPHLQPYGANCARCHGVDGTGGIGPNLHSLDLAQKWAQTGGAQSLNNYVSWVITLGGVVRSGNVQSVMPAWGQDFGGTLTRQQIEALTAFIGEWAAETLENPPPDVDVPDTPEAGAEIFQTAGCAGCHGADLQGGVGPNLQTIGSEPITTIPPLVTATLDTEAIQADYDADPRAFLANWIRHNSTYNGGSPTAMPEFGEDQLNDSQLQALITFLMTHTQ
ncbi:MAG TPA: cytochrome c [Candidatus Limnocylindria bacterium]|jgi:mono/diheme cytochrome c family protein